MKNKYSVYRRKQLAIVLSLCLTLGMGTACSDDYFTEKYEEDNSQMAVVQLNIPRVTSADEPEKTIESVHFIAFESGGEGTSGNLQVNKDITGNEKILMPVGKSNIYIIANAPASWNLNGVTNENILKEKIASWSVATTIPFIMLGEYKGVTIKTGGTIIEADGSSSQALGAKLKRLASKLTVNLKLVEETGKENYIVDSVAVNNRPDKIKLIPQSYKEALFVDSKTDRGIPSLHDIKGDTTIYETMDFYLSEYLVSQENIEKSTFLTFYVHTVGSNEKSNFKVYIGDWFGKYSYDIFKDENKRPGELVGIQGLNVTRNKHYTLNCILKAGETVAMGTFVDTEITEWTLIDIDADVQTPYLYLSTQDIMINPLEYKGTQIDYLSSADPVVTITENPENRFAFNIDKVNNKIYFRHATSSVTRITQTTSSGERVPFTGKATIKTTAGDKTITKTVNLTLFNPISRFYMREYTTLYDTITPSKVIINKVDVYAKAMNWAEAMGYRNPYTGIGNQSLKGANPFTSKMNNVLSDAPTGCSQYWEDSPTDPLTGKGRWRLPRSTGNDTSEAWYLLNYLLNLNYEEEGMDASGRSGQSKDYIWGSTELTDNQARGVGFWGIWFNDSKTRYYLVRCVRDIDGTHNGKDASYLNISKNEYEIAPISYRNSLGAVPIKFESDYPVDIRLLDINGQDISDQQSLYIPFIGFCADTEDKLLADEEPSILFPNWRLENNSFVPAGKTALLNKGYFILHSAVATHRISGARTSVGVTVGKTVGQIKNSTFFVQFKAGSLTKTVKVKVVNPLAVKNVPPEHNNEYGKGSAYKYAISTGNNYVGYDYLTKQYIETPVPVYSSILHLPVPDDESIGCANYYEGNPTDTKTGKGNWLLSTSLLLYCAGKDHAYTDWFEYIGEEYSYGNEWQGVRSFWSPYQIGITDGKNATMYDVWLSYEVAIKNQTKIAYPGAPDPSNSYQFGSIRCERRLNADKLTLSKSNVTFSTTGGSYEVLYYTDTQGIEIKQLYISGSNNTFTTTTTTTTTNGKISIQCKAGATAGTECNLLISTIGKSKTGTTYRIIKLRVK